MSIKQFFIQIRQGIVLVLVLTFMGCFGGPREEVTPLNSLKQLKKRQYPQFVDSHEFEGLEASIDESLTYFKRVPLQRHYQYGDKIFSAAHMIASLETLKSFVSQDPSVKLLNAFIKDYYLVFESVGNEEKEVLFTGYYEPTYPGSLVKEDRYQHPLYTKPDDLLEINLSLFSDAYKGHKRLVGRVKESQKRVVPYYNRGQINSIKDFHLKSTPLAWLESRIDRFFLEIQGSGRIRFETGEEMRVHYAGSNGNAYRSVGRYLIEKGEIPKEKMSMQAIRAWLEKNPDRMNEVLHHNESFVFFTQEDNGPIGSLGVKVTPLRSIATDSKLFPKGGICFIQTRMPDASNLKPLQEWEETSFFVMNQDTGGAIKGPARADLFCGNGPYAEFAAGHKNVYGKLYFLVLDPDRG